MNRNQLALPRTVRGIRTAVFAGMVLLAAFPVLGANGLSNRRRRSERALVDGIARNDDNEEKVLLGPDYLKYLQMRSSHAEDVTNFLEAWSKGHKIVLAGSDKAWLEAGTHGWTMPIPIVKTAAGWHFDTRGAADELRTRRIGRNELDVINVVLAITDAEDDYARYDRDRDGFKQYAQKILSSPGKRDGLYWPTLSGEAASPLGPIGADAKRGEAYHGYHYRILTAQGKDVPGGAKSYVVNGHMTDGYALVAWPEQWGETGVMTFIADKNGVVYEKDLGAKTDAIARAMTAYNPDATWQKVPAP